MLVLKCDLSKQSSIRQNPSSFPAQIKEKEKHHDIRTNMKEILGKIMYNLISMDKIAFLKCINIVTCNFLMIRVQ